MVEASQPKSLVLAGMRALSTLLAEPPFIIKVVRVAPLVEGPGGVSLAGAIKHIAAAVLGLDVAHLLVGAGRSVDLLVGVGDMVIAYDVADFLAVAC